MDDSEPNWNATRRNLVKGQLLQQTESYKIPARIVYSTKEDIRRQKQAGDADEDLVYVKIEPVPESEKGLLVFNTGGHHNWGPVEDWLYNHTKRQSQEDLLKKAVTAALTNLKPSANVEPRSVKTILALQLAQTFPSPDLVAHRALALLFENIALVYIDCQKHTWINQIGLRYESSDWALASERGVPEKVMELKDRDWFPGIMGNPLHGRMKREIKIQAQILKDLEGIQQIDADTVVLMLKTDNPWRAIVGKKLLESHPQAWPIAIICYPVDQPNDSDDLFRDKDEEPLKEFLEKNKYEKRDWITKNVCKGRAGEIVLRKLSFYIRPYN